MPAGKPAGKIAIAITVEAGDWPAPQKLRAIGRKVIGAALAAGLKTVPGSELSLLFTDDAQIKKLNSVWRKKSKATNVLSFPGSSPGKAGFGPFLGDIVLAFETIDRESRAQHLTFEDHLTHLILHGALHLFGFDHAKNNEAVRMEGLETAILGGLGIKDPYRAPGG